MDDSTEKVLVDFHAHSSPSWRIINDDVMGGLSQSQFLISSNSAIFTGNISLENNGGFASCRSMGGECDLRPYRGVKIRLRGDGKEYYFRLHQDSFQQAVDYRAGFTASADAQAEKSSGDWLDVYLPFSSFTPVYRGKTMNKAPPMNLRKICNLGFVISRQPGHFKLEIDYIKAY